jgi:4-amino-4-deoxy-L-arabinose transferase-like glycosyltransferase
MLMSPRRLFFLCLLPLLVFRLWFAAALPITGDEAYFIWWGKIPDWGFYDHPPMIGWWLAAQLALGEAAWWLRLTSVLQPFILAGAVIFMLPRIWPEADGLDPDRRWWAALFTLLAPAAVWNVLITTDTPLIYFSVFSGLAWLRARRDDSYAWYLLAGVFLAGAALSKYFVAFLGFAYLIDTLWRPSKKKLAGLVLTYLCVLPALALMAWWNAGHCWPNFMFNFVNRNEGAGLSWKTPLLYAVMMLYLLTPPVVWQLVRPFALSRSTSSARTDVLAILAFIPLALFALLSLFKTIGMHWVLSFLPFVFMFLALKLDKAGLARSGKFITGFAVLHVLLVLVVSQLPLETWQRTKWYDSAVLAIEGQQIADHLKPYEADYVFASDGYADAVTQGFNSKRYFIVFGEASSHARHDDILTDFRALAGKNILILRKSAPQPGEYAEYFRETSTESFALRGTSFYLVLGRGFDYPHYRDTVLTTVKRKYYAIPMWLPQTACYFCERYFPDTSCRR